MTQGTSIADGTDGPASQARHPDGRAPDRAEPRDGGAFLDTVTRAEAMSLIYGHR
jgi:hypothetical protein